MGKKYNRRQFIFFSYFFFQIVGFHISRKLSPLKTICMKSQSLFSEKKRKNIISLSSAELAKKGDRAKAVEYDKNYGENMRTIYTHIHIYLYVTQ